MKTVNNDDQAFIDMVQVLAALESLRTIGATTLPYGVIMRTIDDLIEQFDARGWAIDMDKMPTKDTPPGEVFTLYRNVVKEMEPRAYRYCGHQ